eukprot:c24999_g5_i1 orf=421-1284(+)
MLNLQEEPSNAEMLPQPSVEEAARILHACRKMRNQVLISCLHSCMLRMGLDAHVSIGNYLIVVLVEGGNIYEAQLVFDRLVYRYVWSWDALISGYNNCEKPQRALTLYDRFREDHSLRPTGRVYVELLKACKKLKDLERGLDIHAEVAKTDLLTVDLFVGSALVDLYAKCGLLAKAQQVFGELPARDVVVWTALIGGYVEHEHGEEALECFAQMQLEGFPPNAVTFVCSLKACGSIGSIDRGLRIHAEIEKKGLLGGDVFVGSIGSIDRGLRIHAEIEKKGLLGGDV